MSLSNAARALPMIEREERPMARPAVKKAKKSAAGVVVASLGWLAVLVLSLFVVHRNSLVLAETNALTGKQETLAKLEQQIAEKSSRVNVSIEEIEKWAQAHSMKRPTSVKAVAADPNAVAPMPEPVQQVAAAAQTTPKNGGLYATVKGFFARFAEAKGAAVPGGN